MTSATQRSYQCGGRPDSLANRIRHPPDPCSTLKRYKSPSYCNSVQKEYKNENSKGHLGFRIRYEPEVQYYEGHKKAPSQNNKHKRMILVQNNDDNDCTNPCLKRSCHSRDYRKEQKSCKSNMQMDNENIHDRVYPHTNRKKCKDTSKHLGDPKSTDFYIFRDYCKETELCKDNSSKGNLRDCRTEINDPRKYIDKYIRRHTRSKCLDNSDMNNYCKRKWMRNTIQPEKRAKMENQSLSCKDQNKLDVKRPNEECCSCEKIRIQVEADESFELNCQVKGISEDRCICSDEDDDRDTYYTTLACRSSSNLNDIIQELNKIESVNSCRNKVSHKECSKTKAKACNSETKSKTQCTQKSHCTQKEFNKKENQQETEKQSCKRGICDYILSSFGSYSARQNDSKDNTSPLEQNKCCALPHASKAQLNDCNDKRPKAESDKIEKDVLEKIFNELKCLTREIENMKNSCRNQTNLSDVKFLIKENRTLKRAFEKFRRSYERDKESLNTIPDGDCFQLNNCRKLEGSNGDACVEMSRSYNEVLEVMSQKLASVLKRFQLQETMVCEKSTSFTKFTDHYRHIIEDYCRNLSTRVNDWFECKRKKIEQREDKLKQEYQTCVNFMETEKKIICDKVDLMKAKFEEYEKLLEQQMNKITTKSKPSLNKSDWNCTLKPKCESFRNNNNGDCKYLFNKKEMDNYTDWKHPKDELCQANENKHKYRSCVADYKIPRKYTATSERKNNQKSKSIAPYCSALNDRGSRNHFVTYNTQIYEMPTEIIHNETNYRNPTFPKRSLSTNYRITQDCKPVDNKGGHSVFNKIKDYFEAENKLLYNPSVLGETSGLNIHR